MRKRLYALLGCLLAAAVIGGCSGSSDTQTSGSGSESGTVAALLRKGFRNSEIKAALSLLDRDIGE